MRIICKIALFLNAFLFMNVLFLGKEIFLYFQEDTYKNYYILVGIIFISVCIAIGLLCLIIIYRKPQGISSICKVVKRDNATGNYYFGYFSLFVLLFLSFDLSNIINLIIFIILFLGLEFVYCRNDLFFINPTILLFGKRIYNVQVLNNGKIEELMVITNEKIATDEEYRFYYSSYSFTVANKNCDKK